MRSILLLSCAAGVVGFASIVGCASGGSPISTGGAGGASSSSSSSSASSSSSTSASSSASSSTSASSSSGGGTGGSGGSGGTGGTPDPGLPAGADCTLDADCASGLCKPVVVGTGPVCVTPCTQNADCGASPNVFCDPLTANATDGYCVPHSPAHCLSCAADADCGSLSEVCFQAPGDINSACHVDCSIAGAAACPSDYACTDQMVAGVARKLCRPKIIPTCLDAIGGFCDRLQLPQACARANTAGTCLGERACLAASKRFDKCGAPAPQCKTDCALQDPAGCMETFCSSATSTIDNCGACGTPCPGVGKPNDVVTCQNGTTCTFACQGEHYDVDKLIGTGCEKTDPTTGNHTKNAALGIVPSGLSCNDSDVLNLTGEHMMSDQRAHEMPAIVGFDATTGSAPDWFKVAMNGGTFCVNNCVATFTVNGSTHPTCYRIDLSFEPSNHTYSCQTGTSGTCSINETDSGNYDGGDTLFIKVSKTCAAAQQEDVTYTVTGHF